MMLTHLFTVPNVLRKCCVIPGMQLRYFSKYVSNSRAKRIPLNTKRAGKGYNKGNGARKEGYVNSKGNFVLKKEMRTELVVPDFTNFKLKPYIASGVKKHIRDVSPSSI